ncbi:hypothetical protein GN956_G12434 [Arapaima gigas]
MPQTLKQNEKQTRAGVWQHMGALVAGAAGCVAGCVGKSVAAHRTLLRPLQTGSSFNMHTSIFFTVFIIARVHLCQSSGLQHITRDVNSAALLPCVGAVPKGQTDIRWIVNNGDEVAQYRKRELTAGLGFKSRVHLSENGIEAGNLSLSIDPLSFSDSDLYICFINNIRVCDVRLDVVVPTEVFVPVGGATRLPCYAPIYRRADDAQLNVCWEKDGKFVLRLQSGSVTEGRGFENRVSVSKDNIRKGDLSLTLNMTRLSDGGNYRCFYNEERIPGDPKKSILRVTAVNNTLTVSEDRSILLPLHTSGPVKVEFLRSGTSNWTTVCEVAGGLLWRNSQYSHRVSLLNGSLQLHNVSPSDSGVYRVMDQMTNSPISINSVTDTVTPSPQSSQGLCILPPVGLVVLIRKPSESLNRTLAPSSNVLLFLFTAVRVVQKKTLGSDANHFRMQPDTFFAVLIVACAYPPESIVFTTVTVNVKGSTLLPCFGTPNGDQTDTTGLAHYGFLVAHFYQTVRWRAR